MFESKLQQKLKWWPSLQDFNEAIQIPVVSLNDAELRQCMPYTNALGLPRPITGAFASVYRMHCPTTDFALRLFLRDIADQSERYAHISSFVQQDDLPYTVTFDFLAHGIKCRGDWFPALKMEWVDGVPFEEYIIANLNKPEKLEALSRKFIEMMNDLKQAGIAHGDLQHGNIIMCEDNIRLVDYDGMFVPAMRNFAATELGHPNYQHPGRVQHHFGPYLDNFSAWVIYASIRALQLDPGLLNQLGGGDDCLLFRQSDFVQPLQSAAFAAFEKHKIQELQMLGSFVRAQLSKDVINVPYLQSTVPEVNQNLASIGEDVSTIKSGPRLERDSDWLGSDNVEAVRNANSGMRYDGNGFSSTQKSWVVKNTITPPTVWVKPTNQSATSKIAAFETRAALPASLTAAPVSRVVKFDASVGYAPPWSFQLLMLCFPCLWLTFFYFYMDFTVDADLRDHATTYDATIINVNRYDTSSKNTVYHHTEVSSLYRVNGRPFFISGDMGDDGGKFKKGDIYPVKALASNPSVHEPYGYESGSKQKKDANWAFLNLIATLVLEALIWFRPIWHNHLAKNGIAVIARIDSLVQTPGPKGAITYTATVSYTVNSTKYLREVNLHTDDFHKLTQGGSEIILCDPTLPDIFVFYKFCLYKVITP